MADYQLTKSMKIPDFNLKPSNNADGTIKEPESNQDTLLNILSYAVNDTYSKEVNVGNGQIQTVSTLSGSQGRMWGRIQRKLDFNADNGSMEVYLEIGEIDFLKKAIEDANFPIAWFRWTVLIEDMLNLKDESHTGGLDVTSVPAKKTK